MPNSSSQRYRHADNLRGHDVTGVKELSKRCEHTSASSHRIPPGSIPSNN